MRTQDVLHAVPGVAGQHFGELCQKSASLIIPVFCAVKAGRLLLCTHFNMPQIVGVPIKLIHECEGHIVTVELNNGEIYRGLMVDAEDNMNCQMTNVTLTARDGKVSKLEYVYIRGSKIRFMILPDMLRNAPMFARFDPKNRQKAPGTVALALRCLLHANAGVVLCRYGPGHRPWCRHYDRCPAWSWAR